MRSVHVLVVVAIGVLAGVLPIVATGGFPLGDSSGGPASVDLDEPERDTERTAPLIEAVSASPDDGRRSPPIPTPEWLPTQSAALMVASTEGDAGGDDATGDALPEPAPASQPATTPAVTNPSPRQTSPPAPMPDPPVEPSEPEPAWTPSPLPTDPPTALDAEPRPLPTEDPTTAPTPTEDPTPVPTPTEDPTPEVTPTEDPTPEVTPTEDPTPEVTPTQDPTPEPTPTEEPPSEQDEPSFQLDLGDRAPWLDSPGSSEQAGPGSQGPSSPWGDREDEDTEGEGEND